jgi:hypothetical protein
MARYLNRLPAPVADDLPDRLHDLLTDAHTNGDLDTAVDAYNDLVAYAQDLKATKAAGHLLNGASHALTFLAHPGAGRPSSPKRSRRPEQPL